ncbi:hypothetical protein Tco_0626043 [Tanacetum coccineum]|uniref:Uncharacterized protein n=1 Tax=Tanacetum coccineum TaxID=301880 RepID=A0ABQ4WJ94_9ASTR
MTSKLPVLGHRILLTGWPKILRCPGAPTQTTISFGSLPIALLVLATFVLQYSCIFHEQSAYLVALVGTLGARAFVDFGDILPFGRVVVGARLFLDESSPPFVARLLFRVGCGVSGHQVIGQLNSLIPMSGVSGRFDVPIMLSGSHDVLGNFSVSLANNLVHIRVLTLERLSMAGKSFFP